MEIRLGYIDKSETESNYNFLDSISEDTYIEFKKAIAEIEEIRANRNLFKIVENNYAELNNLVNSSFDNLLNNSQTISESNREVGSFIYLHLNRHLLNFLSSIRTYIDHAETNFKKKYGKESFEFLELKKFLSSFYDKSFAYRFLYKLRNYAQHCGLPIEAIHYKINSDKDLNRVVSRLKIEFQRDQLLTKYDSWGKTIKEELTELPETFEAIPLFSEMIHNITEISKQIEKLKKNRIKPYVEFVRNLCEEYRKERRDVCIFHNVRESNNRKKLLFTVEPIPFEFIDELIMS